MDRSPSVATWEFMKESGSSEDDGGSPEDEEDELLSLGLKRKGFTLYTSRASPKRQKTAGGLARINGTNQTSAGSSNVKSHRPRLSEPGSSRSWLASTGTSSGVKPSGVGRSSQISVTPSFPRGSESPKPARLSKPGEQVEGKERSVNTGLPVPRSRSSSGPTKIPSKSRFEVIEVSDSTDNDVPPAKSAVKAQYTDTGPPSTICIPKRLAPKSKQSPPSKGIEVITIDDSDEETSSASKLKPVPEVRSKETVGPSLLSSATNYESAPSPSTPKLATPSLSMKHIPTLTPHSGRVDNSDKMNVEINANHAPSTFHSAPNVQRCGNRSDVTTPVAVESPVRKKTLLDLRSPPLEQGNSSLPGPSRSNSSKLLIGDPGEPRPPILGLKSPSHEKQPIAAPRDISGLDMSGLKDVLTDAVSLSSTCLTKETGNGMSPLPVPPSPGRDLRLHSSEASSAMHQSPSDIQRKQKERPVSSEPSTKTKASVHILSRPSDGASECIDLTLDSDSDSPSPTPPVTRTVPFPRTPYLRPAIESSELLKETLTKPEPTSPLSKAKSHIIELDTMSRKTASPPAAARNNTPVRPMPLPTPRPRLPSQNSKKASSVSMSEVQDMHPTGLLLHNPQSPSALTRSHIDGTATTSTGIESDSGHTSAFASSIEAVPSRVPLPPSTARKSTRGRFNNQKLLSPHRLVSTSVPKPPARVPLPPSTARKSTRGRFNNQKLLSPHRLVSTSVPKPPARVPLPPSTARKSTRERFNNQKLLSPPRSVSDAKPASTFDTDSELEYVNDPVLSPSFLEPHIETDSTEMMDVEEMLTESRQDSPDPSSTTRETSPDPLDMVGAEGSQVRRSTRSSRSASGEPTKLFLDDGFADSRNSSPRTSPTPPEDFSVLAPVKTFGGFQSLNWRTYRQDPENLRLKCHFGKDLPHTLQDTINSFSEAGRRHRCLRAVMEASIRENTAEDEPDAPLIEIINEVDDDPTPPWEFHYSNKMWFGEDVPLPDLTKLVHCNCVGRCDPKTKPCACAERQRNWVDGMFHSPDFLYDSKGHVKATDYPVFECNDMCGCSDECRNRVVQHGRKCAIRIQKTAEKGWGVFAGAKKIAAGSFIGVYAGELLTDRVGEMRGITYNKFGRTYLFDLDFWHLKEGKEDWDIQYTVDAYHAGNTQFTRFLNHSCDPNCSLVSCYINDSDLQKPLLTVFAKRDIEPFEELCFSYSGEDGSDDNHEEASRSSPAGDKDAVYVKCACKAWNCTGYMFK